MGSLITLSREGQSRIEIKQSVFIGRAIPVSDSDEANAFVAAQRQTYPDARHTVYAWKTSGDVNMQKYSDDGEPAGTAGMPVLSILEHNGITNAAVAVTRYFGGILLGKGGLVRAYSEALKDAIDKSEFVNEIPAVIVEYKYAYNFDAKIASYLRDNGIKILGTEYSDSINLKIALPEGDLEKTGADLVNITNGSIEELSKEKCMYSF